MSQHPQEPEPQGTISSRVVHRDVFDAWVARAEKAEARVSILERELKEERAHREGIRRYIMGEAPKASTDPAGEVTYGYGALDDWGFWEFPVPTFLVHRVRAAEARVRELEATLMTNGYDDALRREAALQERVAELEAESGRTVAAELELSKTNQSLRARIAELEAAKHEHDSWCNASAYANRIAELEEDLAAARKQQSMGAHDVGVLLQRDEDLRAKLERARNAVDAGIRCLCHELVGPATKCSRCRLLAGLEG